jgi:6-phospho-beta-glucosidase
VKIVTIGAGSTHTPELARGLLDRCERIGLREWWLVDTDPARLEAVGGFVKRMVEQEGRPFRVRSTVRREEALGGAEFVVSQIRVGGMDALREDERLCRRWRLMEHEATGVGGLAGALRTVPVFLNLAQEMRSCCPGALWINLTNPSGILVEALQGQVPDLRSVGLSEGAVGTRAMVAEELGGARALDVHLDYLGLNHLAWLRGARVRGEDVWKRVVSETGPERFENVMVRLGLIWDYYLEETGGRERRFGETGGVGPTRAGQRAALEGKLLSRYADPGQSGLPPERAGKGEGLVSLAAAEVIESAALDLGQEHILSTGQDGAVPDLPPDWVLELPCRVYRDRIEPVPADPLPMAAQGLLQVVKSFELLAVEAALGGGKSTVLAALLAHPLGPDVDHAAEVLEELLDRNRPYLPGFPTFPGSGER